MPTTRTGTKKMEEITARRTKRANRQKNIDTVTHYEKASAIVSKKELSEDELNQLEGQLEEIKDNFDTILKLDDDIEDKLTASKKEADDDVAEASKNQTTNRIRMIQIKKRINDAKNPPKATPAAKSSEPRKTAQLPKLKLPTFDGPSPDGPPSGRPSTQTS
jgi:Asp-tRNA(Asn)/Glu-tRNA(Gln) amidotransferase C subunit